MKLLLKKAGRVPPQWAEPGMFIDFFRRKHHMKVDAFVLHNPSCIKYTPITQYEHLSKLPRGFWTKDPATAAYVVDDGVSAYAVVPWKGKLWWIDPHVVYPQTPEPERFKYSTHMAHDKRRDGWMILKIQHL
jgi:hypothetical protein